MVPFLEPVIRNLIYHIYPVRENEELWRWHVSEILKRKNLFNGRRIISVVTDKLTSPKELVRNAFGSEFDFIFIKNVELLSESLSFPILLRSVCSDNPNEITFYGHAKGVSYLPDGSVIGSREWRSPNVIKHWLKQMYGTNLDNINLVESVLESHGTCGSFCVNSIGSPHYKWYYSGSFFWFRNLFASEREWSTVIKKNRAASEGWPGSVFNIKEAACLYGSDLGDLYVKKAWKKLDKQIERFDTKYQEVKIKKSTVDMTLITPTGDRPESFALCEKWMVRQTFSGSLQWIVVDDGKIPTKVTMEQQYIRRSPYRGTKKLHTLTVNLREALPLCKGEKILIIEDDEWYHPNYLDVMSKRLDNHKLVGAGMSRYYYIRKKTYREFPGYKHSCLCRTGFHKSLIKKVLFLCQDEDPFVDLRLWNSVQGMKEEPDIPLSIGLKGMPGRIAASGGRTNTVGIDDRSISKLKEWIGDDVKYYEPYFSRDDGSKIKDLVVYTTVLNRYDKLRNPLVINQDCKYVCFVDKLFERKSLIWDQVVVPQEFEDFSMQSRYLKINSHKLFPNAEWTLYFDGNMQLLVDPISMMEECKHFDSEADLYLFNHHDRDCLYDEAEEVMNALLSHFNRTTIQTDRYERFGFPENNGLYLGGLLLRNKNCSKFNELWWSEFQVGSKRDQISLPWVLDKSEIHFKSLPALWWKNYFNESKHKKPRKVFNP